MTETASDLPIFSRRAIEAFQPPDCPRTYHIAPLVYAERAEFRAALTKAGAAPLSTAQLREGLRQTLRDLAPDNLDGLLRLIELAEEFPDSLEYQQPVMTLELTLAGQQPYADLLAAHERAVALMPLIACQHALRGWDGPQLPPFRRERGLVPADLLAVLPDDEMSAIGWRAWGLMHVSPSAEKNSAPPSPSPETPEISPAG